jgi:hypothetical protein
MAAKVVGAFGLMVGGLEATCTAEHRAHRQIAIQTLPGTVYKSGRRFREGRVDMTWPAVACVPPPHLPSLCEGTPSPAYGGPMIPGQVGHAAPDIDVRAPCYVAVGAV